MDSKPYISHIDDMDRRKLVSSVIDAFQETIIEGKEGEKFRMGLIHGDFNDANIVSEVYLRRYLDPLFHRTKKPPRCQIPSQTDNWRWNESFGCH